jgi:hypothetical protein
VERAPRPMRCTVVLPAASAYLDGELAEDEARALVAHLATCDACHGVYKDLEGLAEAMAATEPVPAPEGLEKRILAAVKAEKRVPVRVLRWACAAGQCAGPAARWTARLAAAAAFVLALGYAVWYALTPAPEAPLRRMTSPVAATPAPTERAIRPVDDGLRLEPTEDDQAEPALPEFVVRPDDIHSAVAALTTRPRPGVPEGPAEALPPSTAAPPSGEPAPPTIVVPPGPAAPVTQPLPPPHISPSSPGMTALAYPVGRPGEAEEAGGEPATSVPDARLARRTPGTGDEDKGQPEPTEPPRVAELPRDQTPPPSSEAKVLAPRNSGWMPVYRSKAGIDPERLDAAARRIGGTMATTKRAQPSGLPIHP